MSNTVQNLTGATGVIRWLYESNKGKKGFSACIQPPESVFLAFVIVVTSTNGLITVRLLRVANIRLDLGVRRLL